MAHPEIRSFGPCGKIISHENLNELITNGWTVVPDVVDLNTCLSIRNRWLELIESYDTGFVAKDRSTWDAKTVPVSTRGMQDYPPIAQQDFVWETRILLADLFAELWGCEKGELISSMDRICFVPSTSLTRPSKSWWHIDQAKGGKIGKLECVQGFVSLEDIGQEEVSLEVVSGGHNLHRRFIEENQITAKTDWHKFSANDLNWYLSKESISVKRAHCKAGSVVLWDSRTPHQAKRGKFGNQEVRSHRDRFVIYVSMLPKGSCKESILAKRRAAFKSGRATTHWPNEAKLFAMLPRWDTSKVVARYRFDVEKQLETRDREVSDIGLMRSLVG